MTPRKFWTLMKAARDADDGEQFEALKGALLRLKPEEMLAFNKRYEELIDAAYSNDLWGAAYLINGGCSDDGFHYFRVWLVSQGEEVYKADDWYHGRGPGHHQARRVHTSAACGGNGPYRCGIPNRFPAGGDTKPRASGRHGQPEARANHSPGCCMAHSRPGFGQRHGGATGPF